MTVFRMLKYADDDGVLREPSDGEFLARKLKAEDALDFAGVRGVTRAFLDALLKGRPRESIEGLVQGAEGAVADALASWLEPPLAAVKPPSSPPPALSIKAREEGEKYTPTRLSNRLRGQLQRYLESAYPLSDATLIRARRRLLEEAEGGHLLAQEPFVETTPRYQAYRGGYGDVGLPARSAALLDRLTRAPMDHEPGRALLFPELYAHQANALRAFFGDGLDLVVATGTGSGKTECFLVPLLARLYEEAAGDPARFTRRGVRGLILYPMNALVNDQLARLRLLFGSTAVVQEFRALGQGRRHPTFGMYTGRTPYPGPRESSKDRSRVEPLLTKYLRLDPAVKQELLRLGRYPAKDLEAFLAAHKAEQAAYKSGKKKGQAYTKHHWEDRLITGPDDRELLTRQEMVHDPGTGRGAAPDILVTNYSMLEYMLMRPFERPIFEQTAAWLREPGSELLLVLDEAHTYRGARGAEVAFLIRRLLSRLGVIDRSDKIRVICTSASLGGEEAEDTAQRFAADLTGKAPSCFRVIFGVRELPRAAASGDGALAEVLAAVPLEALQGGSGEALVEAVEPVLRHLGDTGPAPGPAEVPARLVAALEGRPWLSQVLAFTAGRARPLRELGEAVFPGVPAESQRKATEVLLSLGTLARRAPGEPSLLPTRIHMMFRGLSGIYACSDPCCPGRQERPGEKAPVGRLFATPRTLCDACGARVFELASCRDCGGAYLMGRVPRGQLDTATFLWGEVDGDLEPVEILPAPPRNEEAVEEALLLLSTGSLVSPAAAAAGARVRSIWLPRSRETGRRAPAFARCPICQPAGSRARSRIADLGTRGEQPFTALVEAQFAEQPPPKPDLSNGGRKVLVFSDGRQRAARLAPALETSHARDAFRQVLLLAAQALEQIGRAPQVASLYPALLKVCADRDLDLFPEGDEDEFHNHLHLARRQPLERLLALLAQRVIQPTQSYGKSLFAELTDRYFSLQAMGLAAVEEEPSVDYIFDDFPDIGLSAAEARAALRIWMRLQLERRKCFLPPGVTPGHLGEPWERPQGINLLDATTDLLPARFSELIAAAAGAEAVERLSGWLRGLGRGGFLVMMNDAYYLQAGMLALRPRLHERWLRCRSCSRLDLSGLRGLCGDCLGEMAPVEDELYLDAKYGYYRDQVVRALGGDGLEPFGLITAEHSAQLSTADDDEAFTKTEMYELRFQDVKLEGEPAIDVLSCTTTMEVGIDIGALTGVALRNVPPHVANYQQRAGRAGRRGRAIASVITYAHGGSHDAWYYEHPERIISGDVRPPIVYTENLRILERHVNAFLIQAYFHENVDAEGQSFQLFASLGTVRDFLSPDQPCSLDRLVTWLRDHAPRLRQALREWIPRENHGLSRKIRAETLIEGAIPRLIERLTGELPVRLLAERERLEPARRESLEMQLDELLLQTLIDRAILPRYAFPTDVVSFWVPEQRRPGVKVYKRSFDYQPQRDLQIALSEYAPGRTLTIDKIRFESAALYSPYQPDIGITLGRARSYTACRSCGFMTLDRAARGLPACPVCGEAGLAARDFVRPEGFAPDVNEERQVDRGGAISYAGMSTPAKLEVQTVPAWDESRYEGRLQLLSRSETLVVVNKGIGDRGFIICPRCGSAEPVFGPGFTQPHLVSRDGRPVVHNHPLEEGGKCAAAATGPFYLGHQFVTDVLLLRASLAAPVRCGLAGQSEGRAGRMALTSLVEAVCLAASRTLQIDEGELAGNWNPVPREVGQAADLYLYDLLPGGAGYTHQVKRHLGAILEEARALLAGCDCASSCHRCLRHYNNQPVHTTLDRLLGLSLLDHLLEGTVPSVTEAEVNRSLEGLLEMLRLQGIRFDVGPTGESPVPLRVERGDNVVWVDVHHPLVDPVQARADVLEAAAGVMAPLVELDTHTLLYDLPEALQRVIRGSG